MKHSPKKPKRPIWTGGRNGEKEADLDKPKDTIELIAAAHKRITRKDSPIKNGSFYNADTSVDVDASILDINTMYDREKLLEFIHGLAVAFDEAPTTGATPFMP